METPAQEAGFTLKEDIRVSAHGAAGWMEGLRVMNFSGVYA